MKNRLSPLPMALLLVAGVAAAQTEKAVPDSDLALAQARAKVHNKRVMLVVSAEGEDFQQQLKKRPGLSRTLLYEFEMVPLTATVAAAKWKWQGEGGGVLVLASSGEELARFPAMAL